MILLGIVTLGIYPLVVNTVAKNYDGEHTMHYCLIYFVFSWLTLGIVPLIWFHRISARIGNELKRRGISYEFGASDFWLWNILGSPIIVGPFIYIHKFMHAMNHLNADYNQKG